MAFEPAPVPPTDEDCEELQPGDQIGCYEILEVLGSGGMGTVYRARDSRLGRFVAIKTIRTDDERETQRLLREAQATAKVAHESIVSIFDVGEFEGRPFIVFEYVKGRTLNELLTELKRFPEGRALEILLKIAHALVAAHGKGIIHRDMKLENVMISTHGVLKIVDFGIAKATGIPLSRLPTLEPLPRALRRQPSELELPAGASNLTGKNALLGTLRYMAPEQWRCPHDVDARVDLFAFGIIAHLLLTGSHPAGYLQGMEWGAYALSAQPYPRLGPEFSPALADIVARCLEKDREKRFPDALALLKALQSLAQEKAGRSKFNADQCPYPGLVSFQESDAGFFFGRDAASAELVTRVRERPLTILTGSSGVGKSSLARAALAPALKGSGEGWDVLFMPPGRDPLGALAAAITPMTGTPTSATVIDDLISQDEVAKSIRREPGFPGRVLRAYASREKRRLLLCVDQFEELYTVGSEADRSRFTACLAGIADDPSSPLRLLITLRSDFLGPVAEDARLGPELGPALFFLAPPDRHSLRQAIEGPARAVAYNFESGIVDDMLEHLGSTPSSLPLVQFAGSKLWETRNTALRVLTTQSYEQLGRITGALGRYADAIVSALSPQLQSSARALFLRLVTPQKTGAVVPLATLQEMPNGPELIEQLVRARLIVIERSEREGSTAELAHDALIQHWDTLARWVESAGLDLAFREQLASAATLWSSNAHDNDLLWRSEMLEDAKRFQKRHEASQSLSRVELAFIEEATALETREARRKRKRVMAAMGLLAAAALASAVAVGIIAKAKVEAVQQARIARQAEGLAVKAEGEARRQAEAARAAETQARERLIEVQEKERERAEAARRAEEAKEEVKQTNDRLQIRNTQLLKALSAAEASSKAERRAKEQARRHEAQAVRAARALEIALGREKERVSELQGQVGSPFKKKL